MLLPVLLALAAQAPTAPIADPPKKERKICKVIDDTGSRLGGARDCRTAAQWKAAQVELDARDLNEVNNMKGHNAGDFSKP